MTTYGDTFTLDSIRDDDTGAPIIWKVEDARSVADAGEMYSSRAWLVAVGPDGTRASGGQIVKIGRTVRHWADVGTAHKIESANGRLRGGIWSSALTANMGRMIDDDFAAVALDLPGWTLEEFRTALIAAARKWGERAGYLSGHANRAPWDEYRQNADARAWLAEAMDAATRERMRIVMCDAFARQAAQQLKVGGAR